MAEYKDYINSLSEIEKSALLETFNIGASHAATALYQMTGIETSVSVPSIEIVPIKDVGEEFKDEVKVAVYVELGKEFDGHIFFITDFQDALKICGLMLGTNECSELDELGKSSIMEMGNILASAFATAISNFLGITIDQTPPQMVIDFLPAIIDLALIDIAKYSEYTILLKTDIKLGETLFEEHLLVFPRIDGMKAILKKLKEVLGC